RDKGHNTVRNFSDSGANIGEQEEFNGPFENENNLFSYRVGLVFKPTPDVSLYVAHGNSKNASQAAVDGSCAADSCNLKPETTKNYEAGIRADLFDKALLLTAAVFRNDRD